MGRREADREKDGRPSSSAQLESLGTRREGVQEKLQELKEAGEGAWEEVRAAVECAWRERERAVDDAAANFNRGEREGRPGPFRQRSGGDRGLSGHDETVMRVADTRDGRGGIP